MIYEQVVVLSVPFADAVAKAKEAFAAEGFGALTEIDIQGTLAAKAGKKMDHYMIIGACNPELAGRALDAEPQIGVLLPCNVVVRQTPSGVLIEAMDPGVMATLAGTDAIRPIADEARRRVAGALDRLMSRTS